MSGQEEFVSNQPTQPPKAMEMTPRNQATLPSTEQSSTNSTQNVILGLRGGHERGFLAGCLGALCICCACDACLDCVDDCCC